MNEPDPKLKGIEGGNCNRTACQAPFAIWYNTGTHAYYCRHCAIVIQRSANDFAFQVNEAPMVLFKGIFNKADERHKRCDDYVTNKYGLR